MSHPSLPFPKAQSRCNRCRFSSKAPSLQVIDRRRNKANQSKSQKERRGERGEKERIRTKTYESKKTKQNRGRWCKRGNRQEMRPKVQKKSMKLEKKKDPASLL
jgi:hypothetical protein